MGLTKQRKHILDIVRNSSGHMTAEDVLLKARDILPNISMGTVYRNLNILADTGMLRRLCLPNEPVMFDKTSEPHEHYLCVRCGSVMDACANDPDLLVKFKRPDMVIVGHELVMYCICPDCKKNIKSL